MTLSAHNDEFCGVGHHSYLAHCAISPMAECVRQAMRNSLDHFSTHGVHDYGLVMTQMRQLKTTLSELFGGSPQDFAFIPNTSFGINQVAHGLHWNKGDRILLFDGEFPTNIRPWVIASQYYDAQIEYHELRSDPSLPVVDLEALEKRLKDGVRLVAMSAVQFQTGRCMPVQEIQTLCRNYGSLLFVDAIQACGGMPFDGSNLDFWVAGGHKWMLGPEGTGFLFIHPQIRNTLTPRFQGWLSVEDPLNFLFEGSGLLDYMRPLNPTAEAFELGTHNRIGCAGLLAAAQLLQRVQPALAFEKVQAFHDAVEQDISELGFVSVRAFEPSERSNILSFLLPPDAPANIVVPHFAAHGVIVTAPDGHLRIAPHYWNQLEEIRYIKAAIKALHRSRL